MYACSLMVDRSGGYPTSRFRFATSQFTMHICKINDNGGLKVCAMEENAQKVGIKINLGKPKIPYLSGGSCPSIEPCMTTLVLTGL